MKINDVEERKSVLGIDIGTTNISAVVLDADQNTVLETYVIANDSKLLTDNDLSEFDVNWIVDKSKQMIDDLVKAYPNIKSIGITGQMHGVLYVSEEGQAVSALYNWQDGRGNRKINSETTYCKEIFNRTGYTVFSGYGCSTLFYNRYHAIEPDNANSFCTIMDYIAMSLTGITVPVLHPSNAASLGMYNITAHSFDKNAFEKLALSHLTLPEVSKKGGVIGYYQNIPVSIAIGDNQASFLGSVKNQKSSALVNFGTGSQISVVIDEMKTVDDRLEVRPYLFGKYLLCGSALCGGKAYSILEQFFSKYAAAVTNQVSSQYEIMNDLSQKAYLQKKSLSVSTQFCGTRKNPDLRGWITGISDENFTPENLILGVLQGMVDELKLYFGCMDLDHITGLIASGNAVKKNPVLKELLKDTFHLPVEFVNNDEEAAIGAALYAGISSALI